ncbi:hypothetical protein LP420_32170 [Massilia sp. B-10]|nr:hypothetical protein LP420_32170 [Massilia sp. B-10]
MAQPPAPPTWLNKLFLRGQAPVHHAALPGTDGVSIWLLTSLGSGANRDQAAEHYRILMLQQAMRAVRGSVLCHPAEDDAMLRALYRVLEARAADDALCLGCCPARARRLPRCVPSRCARGRRCWRSRRRCSRSNRWCGPCCWARPMAPSRLAAFPGSTPVASSCLSQPRSGDRAGEGFAACLQGAGQQAAPTLAVCRLLERRAAQRPVAPGGVRGRCLARPPTDPSVRHALRAAPMCASQARTKTRLGDPGPSMVQTAQPHEQAEDPMGMQRPTDHDAATSADEFADALSELPEARLVSSPARSKEVLLSDDPPDPAARTLAVAAARAGGEQRQYPEWDWRSKSYRMPGATVRLSPAVPGPMQWVDQTLAERATMLGEIRRRFELLRAQRTRVRQQLDGAEVDVQAWVDSRADCRAYLPQAQRLYQSERRGRRDMAVSLLVDVSGSTDGWIAPNRRVIDVEREALLLVCIALDSLNERFSVQAFSGEGPQGVVVRKLKDFGERYDVAVAQRIA